MIQRGEDFGLTLESRQTIGITGKRGRKHLDCHVAFQFRVCRAIDLAHPADADLRGHFIRAETGAWSQGQTLWII